MSTYLLLIYYYIIIYKNIIYPLYDMRLKFIKTLSLNSRNLLSSIKKVRLQLLIEESYYLIIKLISHSS